MYERTRPFRVGKYTEIYGRDTTVDGLKIEIRSEKKLSVPVFWLTNQL